ncbi:hypothetical protein [Hymenobacter negativus]|uniref:Uncharacterized protein n=1 Tax=Hymenobacter negativus TaxID=2795026 RepID=A0ABS3QJ73_9BACT|nr:hypothetical protein [Hymenobacter negativus]MBO2011073.1 hypothetical protein [Hymenobacter negativus]
MTTSRLRILFPIAGTLGSLLLGTGCVRQQFFQPDARPNAAQPLSASADSVRGATAGRQYARHGGLYNALVGRHHRPTWAAPVAVPVLHLPKAQLGGLKPGKVGGGFNSTSLALTTTDGHAYVVRTVDKDPIRATPQWLRGTFLVNALRDNISATNPYASLTVPVLAEAVGVPHANPRLFYVRADDPAFQTDSLRHFRGQLGLLEEKAAPLPARQPAPSSVINSTKAFNAVFTNSATQFDQPALLRARLLDGWMGDWDRHPGQWSWSLTRPTKTGHATLLPLPKDRDMVFYRLDDGVLGWLVSRLALRHWVTFAPRYKNLTGLMSSGHYLDQRGLNELNRAQFRATALAMQQQLPDTLITRAVHRLPAPAFALEGPRTIAALQTRRDKLPDLADAFYQQLARRPRIGGTAQAERFTIHRYADSTVVTVQTAVAAPVLYRRAFLPTETQRIQIEGLGGNDVFAVEEHGNKPGRKPAIRVFGGAGADEMQAARSSKGIRFIQESVSAGQAFDTPPEE